MRWVCAGPAKVIYYPGLKTTQTGPFKDALYPRP
jgi:hypothetical protein